MPVRVALLEPVGDAGIAGYTHELAQALVTAGAEVDCFGLPSSFARTLHRDYRLYAALGLPAADAAWRLPAPAAPPAPAPPRPEPALAPYLERLARWRPRATVTPPPPPSHVPAAAPHKRKPLRDHLRSLEIENSQLKSQIAELSLEYASLRTALVRDL